MLLPRMHSRRAMLSKVEPASETNQWCPCSSRTKWIASDRQPTSAESQPHQELKKWALQYGEVFKVQLGWQNWVFVNSPDAVKEIFEH